MRRRLRNTILFNVTMTAVFVASCSKSNPENNAAPSRSDATMATKPAPAPAAPAPKPGSGPAVLKASLSLADGGTCTATVDRDCQECVQQQCDGKAAVLKTCESLTGNAAAGPAAGQPRSGLCREALDCMRRTKCHANSLVECYCGPDIDLGTCHLATIDAKGACKAELDRALEIRPGSTGGVALSAITEPDVAGGVAGILATCENTRCANVCIPYQATSCL